MSTIMTVVRFELISILAGLGAIVAYQIITGRINTRGLLSDTGNESISPARVQLLMFTFGVAFYVLGKVLGSIAAGPVAGALPGLEYPFPDVDPTALVVLGGSHALYLGAKALPQSSSKPDDSNN